MHHLLAPPAFMRGVPRRGGGSIFGLPQSKLPKIGNFASPLASAGAEGGVAAKCPINRNWLPA